LGRFAYSVTGFSAAAFIEGKPNMEEFSAHRSGLGHDDAGCAAGRLQVSANGVNRPVFEARLARFSQQHHRLFLRSIDVFGSE